METAYMNGSDSSKHSQYPVCTGGVVIALQFDGGVVLAADTLASYGKMARYRKVSRLLRVNKECIVAVSGDYADFQYLENVIHQKISDMECRDPEAMLSPRALHNWLTAVMYKRRNKFDPLWNTYLVGGVLGDEKKPYLGSVNLLGNAYNNPYIATGLGNYSIQEMLETAYRAAEKGGATMTKEKAMQLMEKSLELLFYRDCTAHYEFQIAVVDGSGATIQEPKELVTNWDIAKEVRGYD